MTETTKTLTASELLILRCTRRAWSVGQIDGDRRDRLVRNAAREVEETIATCGNPDLSAAQVTAESYGAVMAGTAAAFEIVALCE